MQLFRAIPLDPEFASPKGKMNEKTIAIGPFRGRGPRSSAGTGVFLHTTW
jgi:hypothetical protein